MIPLTPMAQTAELVARAVLQNTPYVRCFPCLSSQVGVPEKDAREAAQLLVVREEFFTSWRCASSAAAPMMCS
jgi:hypothetical protein